VLTNTSRRRIYIIPATSFLDLELHNQHSLLELPATKFHAFMQHYYRCKARAPHTTSACIIVPGTRGPWKQYFSDLQIVADFPKGFPLFVDPRTDQRIPTVHRWLALYDPPVPLLQLNAFSDDHQALHMTFPGTLSGHKVQVLVDTGASHSFIDKKFAERCGFHITPDNGSVKCGGSTTAAIKDLALYYFIYPLASASKSSFTS